MKINPWTLGLAAAGVVTLASAVHAEEATESVKTLVSSTTLSGYVNTSAHWNRGSLPGVANYSYGAGKTDRFNLDVVSLTLEKPVGEGDWAAGYKAQLWFGPDANALATSSSGLGNVNDINLKNAYVALHAPLGNGLDIKLGVFDTLIGYEVCDAPDNPNYTRSWGFTMEPTQHTGVLASYKFNDIISASVAVANSMSPVINGVVRNGTPAPGTQSQSEKAYLAAITLTAPDSLGFLKGGTLTAGVCDGRFGSAAATTAKPDTTHIYVGATVPTPLESLKAGVAWDHSQQATTTAVNTSDADAIAGYIAWQATEKLKLNVRADYLDDGRDLLGFGASGYGAAAGAAGASAFAGEYFAATLTVDYALWANVISRLEYRWDHDLSGGRHFPGTTAATGVNNASLLALNIIYKF